MSHTPPLGTEPEQSPLYELRIKGHLGSRWNDWFDQMTITAEADGETTLIGPIVDQAALHGVLTRIRDLGLQLLSVKSIGTQAASSPEESTGNDSPLSIGAPANIVPTDHE